MINPFKLIKSMLAARNGDFRHQLAVAVIIRDEAPYIEEWIEYHKIVGVDKFYIYDNESRDGVKKVLKPYILSKLVEYTFLPGSRKQLTAYKDAVRRHKYECKWIALIDADEFIVPIKHSKITDILPEYSVYPALGVNWMMYGSSNHETTPLGLVIKNYEHRAEEGYDGNLHIKSIVNPRKVVKFVNAHCCRYVNGEMAVNEMKENIESAVSNRYSGNIVRINHYFTKSKEEFMNKISRGKADSYGKRQLSEFDLYDRNEVYDGIMGKYFHLLEDKAGPDRH